LAPARGWTSCSGGPDRNGLPTFRKFKKFAPASRWGGKGVGRVRGRGDSGRGGGKKQTKTGAGRGWGNPARKGKPTTPKWENPREKKRLENFSKGGRLWGGAPNPHGTNSPFCSRHGIFSGQKSYRFDRGFIPLPVQMPPFSLTQKKLLALKLGSEKKKR